MVSLNVFALALRGCAPLGLLRYFKMTDCGYNHSSPASESNRAPTHLDIVNSD